MLPNKPLEWTGHHQLSAMPPLAVCLPLRGSVGPAPGSDTRIDVNVPADVLGVDTLAIVLEDSLQLVSFGCGSPAAT
jgi:hypothetical protein